ncbi:hypothetical protein AK812_SmicGene40561 [Symbiodinium microadriaticum]|uniref:Calx-beta domain-containing protein n=2 Tax=Symbiodinium TaxID=2949 RepID=A0A1Q9C8B2_SYMMI|nr:hypothetical protein AK812_SmicGene40561 [Symbiodinium microadriaticum]
MDDSDLEIFKLQIAEPALQWDEMEPALRDKLRLSEQARADFLAVRRRTDLRAYDPKEGRFTEEAATNRRHDFEATSSDTVMEGLDPQLNEAMLRYHSNNVLPNLTKLFEQCGIFYGQVMQETSMQQMTNERIAAQPRSKALNDPVQTAQAQVAYVLDARYSRRYCCLLLLCEEHYTAILERWHGAFSQRMTSTMNLIQALRRAVIDRTTTTRPTYDKAFDVSNVMEVIDPSLSTPGTESCVVKSRELVLLVQAGSGSNCTSCIAPSMTMHGKVECRPAGRARTLAAGHVLLAAAGLLLWKLSAGGSDSTFVEGISKVVSGETRQVQVHMQSLKIPVEKKYRFEGTTRAKYLKRLRHRRWCAQFTYPRTFGYVLKWNDTAGEGVVIDQEQTQKYLVIRDEIGSSYHAHKTLQPAEFVEFFATDEMDEVTVHRINKDWQDSQLYNGNTCDGDVVQFLSKTFYVKETEEFSIIRVIRIGQVKVYPIVAAGRCSDGSAVAGHKYVEGGRVAGRFEEGCVKSLRVEILNDDAFDTTLEFDVQLDEPENCLIDPRCAKCVVARRVNGGWGQEWWEEEVMIVDDDLFPSNDHQEVIEDHDEEALYEASSLHLRKTILVLLLANLGNLYYLATIFLRLCMNLLGQPPPMFLRLREVPGDRDATAVALGLAWILPNAEACDASTSVLGFNIRYHLRVNLFRKYLRYTPESRAKVPIQEPQRRLSENARPVPGSALLQLAACSSRVLVFQLARSEFAEDLKISIMEDIPDLVSDGCRSAARAWSAVPLFVYPILISVYLAVTYRRRLALMAKEGEGQSATIGTLMHVNNAQKLIGCYNKRSYVVRTFPAHELHFLWRFEESLRNQRKWVMDLKFFDFWNAQLIPWITLLAEVVVVGMGIGRGLSSRLVLSGTTSLGSFLATINVYKDLGDRFSTILEGLECLSKAISPLAALTTQFNLPIDIPERSEAHKMREEFVLGLSTAAGWESVWMGVFGRLRKALFDVTSALFPCPAVDVRDDQVEQRAYAREGVHPEEGILRRLGLDKVRVFIRKKTVVQDQPDSPFSACFGEDPEEEEEEEEEEALPPWAQQLSSSEKWRFQLARALRMHGYWGQTGADPNLSMNRKSVLLVHRPADELDPQMQEKVLSCFRDFVDRRGLEINEEIGSHLPPDRRRPRTADYVWRIGKDGVQVENQRSMLGWDFLTSVSNMPMAKNVTGPHGNFLKTNRDYRELMLRSGTFPKRWEDTYDEYEKKVGEWWTQPKWKCGFGVK